MTTSYTAHPSTEHPFADFLSANAPLVATLACIVLAIVVIGCALEAFRLWTRHRQVIANAPPAAVEAKTQAERLEQRVRVLERIVTDRGLTLGDEIERLRTAVDDPALS